MRRSVRNAIAAGGVLLLGVAFGYYMRGALAGSGADSPRRGAVVAPLNTGAGAKAGSVGGQGASPAATRSDLPTLQPLSQPAQRKMVNIGLGHHERPEGSEGGEDDR